MTTPAPSPHAGSRNDSSQLFDSHGAEVGNRPSRGGRDGVLVDIGSTRSPMRIPFQLCLATIALMTLLVGGLLLSPLSMGLVTAVPMITPFATLPYELSLIGLGIASILAIFQVQYLETERREVALSTLAIFAITTTMITLAYVMPFWLVSLITLHVALWGFHGKFILKAMAQPAQTLSDEKRERKISNYMLAVLGSLAFTLGIICFGVAFGAFSGVVVGFFTFAAHIPIIVLPIFGLFNFAALAYAVYRLVELKSTLDSLPRKLYHARLALALTTASTVVFFATHFFGCATSLTWLIPSFTALVIYLGYERFSKHGSGKQNVDVLYQDRRSRSITNHSIGIANEHLDDNEETLDEATAIVNHRVHYQDQSITTSQDRPDRNVSFSVNVDAGVTVDEDEDDNSEKSESAL